MEILIKHMKIYSAQYEDGRFLFENVPASELFVRMPAGSKPLTSQSKNFKDIPHAIFKTQPYNKNLIVYEVK